MRRSARTQRKKEAEHLLAALCWGYKEFRELKLLKVWR